MEKCITPEFRVSFPNVFEPKAFEGNDPKYGIVMLFDKSQDLSKLKELMKKAVEEKWPDVAKRPKGLRNPIRDGDVDKAGVDGYQNKVFITASSKMKPALVDQNMQPIISAEDFYAGCYARASLTCYAYDKMGNKGVAFGLQNIQKMRDGEPFSGRSKPEDDFTALDGFVDAGSPKVQAVQDDMFA